nr:hypothetical protein CFP56_59095 [Quercus suber]
MKSGLWSFQPLQTNLLASLHPHRLQIQKLSHCSLFLSQPYGVWILRFWLDLVREHGIVSVGVDFGESRRRLRSTFATTVEEDHADADCQEPWGIDL